MRALMLPSLLLLALNGQREELGLPAALANENRRSGGTLRDGVLHITLEAKQVMWYPDGDSLPGIPVEAFAEPGQAPLAPGPLIRVPRGTRIQLTVRNALPGDTITFVLPSSGAPDPRVVADSVSIPSGASRELTTSLRPGTYLYRAWTSTPIGRAQGTSGLLSGAIVVDSVMRADRIFVLSVVTDSLDAQGFSAPLRSVFAINGRTWPHTERLDAMVGDSVHWRVVNPTHESHPMHLHGFYFRVDAAAGPHNATGSRGPIPRMAVTERMTAQSTLELTWVPERAGNWLFHCHFQVHVLPHGRLDSLPSTDHPRIGNAGPVAHHVRDNHALTGMSGLALGVVVHPRPGSAPAEAPASKRKLRLLVVEESGFPDSARSMRYTLDPDAVHRPGSPESPTLSLSRGEPVAITVVNRLREPTAVHWHGIELESYFDGVAGFSGSAQRTSPVIAPGDSFVARFTPPRAGTFIYHSHIDEVVQHRAGLVGALIVREPGDKDEHELLWLIKTPRDPRSPAPVAVNGSSNPDTTVLRAGAAYRVRLINMTIGNPGATVWLTARPDSATFRPMNDSLGLTWRPLAKDGADYSKSDRIPRVANQQVSIGETYDFELVPAKPGNIRLEIWGDVGRKRLLARVPIRVQ